MRSHSKCFFQPSILYWIMCQIFPPHFFSCNFFLTQILIPWSWRTLFTWPVLTLAIMKWCQHKKCNNILAKTKRMFGFHKIYYTHKLDLHTFLWTWNDNCLGLLSSKSCQLGLDRDHGITLTSLFTWLCIQKETCSIWIDSRQLKS